MNISIRLSAITSRSMPLMKSDMKNQNRVAFLSSSMYLTEYIRISRPTNATMLLMIMLSGSTSMPTSTVALPGSVNQKAVLSRTCAPERFGIMETVMTNPRNENSTTVASLIFLPTFASASARSAPIAGKIHVSQGAMSEFQNIVSTASYPQEFLRSLLSEFHHWFRIDSEKNYQRNHYSDWNQHYCWSLLRFGNGFRH